MYTLVSSGACSVSRCPGDCIASTMPTADEAGIETGTGTGTETELLPLQCSSQSAAEQKRGRETLIECEGGRGSAVRRKGKPENNRLALSFRQ